MENRRCLCSSRSKSRNGLHVRKCRSFYCRAKYDKVLIPFDVREYDLVQYGSDETKHRKIKHILGQKQHDKVGRLLVNYIQLVPEAGQISSHKHDTNRIPKETRHDETYNFRFKPNWGLVCRCFNGVTMNQETHITLLTALQFVSITAITLVAFCLI